LPIEQPGGGRDSSACDFHPPLARVLCSTLIRDQVVQGRPPRQKRPLAPVGMMPGLHQAPLPGAGLRGLRAQGARPRPLRSGEHRLPARLLLLPPAPSPLPLGPPRPVGPVLGQGAAPLAQRTPPPALTLPCAVPPGGELRAECRAHRRRERRAFSGELGERVAETVAEAHARPEAPPTLGGDVAASGAAPFAPRRGLLGERRAWQRPLRLGQSRGTGLCGVAERPEHTAPANGGHRALVGATAAVLLVSQERRGQRKPTPAQHGHQAVGAHGAKQALERHRREVIEHRAQCSTEATGGGPPRSTGPGWSPRALPPDAVGQDGAYRVARGALDPPEGAPTPAGASVRGVTRQAPAAAPARLVRELQAQGAKNSEAPRAKRLAMSKQTTGGGLSLESAGDRAMGSCPFARLSPVSPLVSGLGRYVATMGGTS
jgi:hypothetical protein